MIRFRTKHKTSVSQRNRGFVETLIMRGPTSNFRRGKYDLLWRTAPLTQGIIESNKGRNLSKLDSRRVPMYRTSIPNRLGCKHKNIITNPQNADKRIVVFICVWYLSKINPQKHTKRYIKTLKRNNVIVPQLFEKRSNKNS